MELCALSCNHVKRNIVMRFIFVTLSLLTLGACTVGDLPPEREAMYEINKPDCNTNPEKCVQGYPW